MRRRRPQYFEQSRAADYGAALAGLSHTQLQKQRGLKGCKFGPANPGRKLTKTELTEIERQMRKDGKL